MDFKEYKPGDVCVYEYDGENESLSVVEIVKILNDERGVAEIKFIAVIKDDTGNGFFKYLLETGGTMNASMKYLEKIEHRKKSTCGLKMTESLNNANRGIMSDRSNHGVVQSYIRRCCGCVRCKQGNSAKLG